MAGLVEDLVCLASGQALVPKVNGQTREFAQLSGKCLGFGCARARFAGEMDRVADHDSDHSKPAAETRQRTYVLSPTAPPVECENWLCCKAQLVRDGHADAAAADVKAEIAWRPARFHYAAPHIQLTAQLTALSHSLLRGGSLRARQRFDPGTIEGGGNRGGNLRASFLFEGRVQNGRMARRRRSGGKKKGSGAAGFLLILLLVVVLAGGAAGWLIFTPYGPETETFVDVVPGSSATRIGRQLEAAGVVRSRYAFDLVRWMRHGTLHAGMYRFDHPAPVAEVYGRIARGDVFTIALTVPEGANIFEIAARVQEAKLGTRQDFLDAAMSQTELVADLDPSAKSLEGYLFPDTYRFSPKVTAKELVGAMVKRFRVVATQLGLGENVHHVVTIASLVERETAVNAERPLVASVFENRLARNMPLNTDPAVIYGLEVTGYWRGAIHQSDLTRDTPYNTYLHTGLTPGPVCNPGIPSLRAAIDPPKTNYLYFVAAGTNAQGHSLFAETLDEHNRNVANYRKAQKKAGER